MDRLRRLGLQRRIMLLVTVGLATMFTIGGFLGLNVIDQAAELVFRERLATAYATVAMVERDFDRLAADVALVSSSRGDGAVLTPDQLAGDTLGQIGADDRYPFFSVSGVTVLGEDGEALATVGDVLIAANTGLEIPAAGQISIVLAEWEVEEGIPFVDLSVPVSASSSPGVAAIVAHTISTNSPDPFTPARATEIDAVGAQGPGPARRLDGYNLEIVTPDGSTALSIGQGSPAGSLSAHMPAIEGMLTAREATALIDRRASDPHVMAGVPIRDSPLYLVLEQPVDVALALPNELREQLLILIAVGFIGALTVAWFTTRRVVKPTEELTLAASQMARGDLTEPIDVSAQDEIGILAETLELMRNRLLDAQEELVNVNVDLERRIDERTARLGFVLRKTISAQEDERHALARELHDETAQTLAALTIALDRAREDVGAGPDKALERISEAKAIAARLLSETRRLIMGLRPSILDDLGLGPAIAWYAETVMAEREQGVVVRVDAPAERLPRHLEVALFRIAQEALNNVAKHAAASNVLVRMRRYDDEVELSIEDDGEGFDVEPALARAAGAGGVGLAGMQERVALLGGSMKITSEPGRGTVIRVRAPITTEDR
ncbi:MAG: ATP-binding protein [Chloroflexota bacterium]